MRFLFAWEQGGRLGHLSQIVPVARLLKERGHEVLFAVKELGTAHTFLRDEDFGCIQAPLPTGLARSRREAVSFADILSRAGFGDAAIFGGMVRAWRTVFALYNPDVILSQYAPVATQAAGLFGIPCLNLSSGFESPPETSPYPSFRPWLNLTRETLLAAENRLLENINKVRGDFGEVPLSYLYQSIRADVSLLATLPELDSYPGRKNGRCIGPLFTVDEGEELHWSGCREKRIFVYLVSGGYVPQILDVLRGCGAEVIAFIPGVDDGIREAYDGTNMRICSGKVNLSRLLPGMSLAVHNANLGTLSAMLLSGVPSLCIPTHIEQLMNACCMERIGAGIVLKQGQVKTRFAEALNTMRANNVYRTKAVEVSMKYAGYDQKRVVGNLSNTLEKMTSYPNWTGGS